MIDAMYNCCDFYIIGMGIIQILEKQLRRTWANNSLLPKTGHITILCKFNIKHPSEPPPPHPATHTHLLHPTPPHLHTPPPTPIIFSSVHCVLGKPMITLLPVGYPEGCDLNRPLPNLNKRLQTVLGEVYLLSLSLIVKPQCILAGSITIHHTTPLFLSLFLLGVPFTNINYL